MLLRMQRDEQSSVVVTDSCQTLAFTNPLLVRVLMACALEECSLSALHSRLDAPLSQLHYHVSRLLGAKLLTVSRAQPRAGRAIRFYRAVADSFIVPQHSLPAQPGDDLSVQLRQALRDEQSRSDELGALYTPAPGGKVLVKLVPQVAAASSRCLELWRILTLDAEQRASLATDLSEVLERYTTASSKRGTEELVVHAAFAPQRSRR